MPLSSSSPENLPKENSLFSLKNYLGEAEAEREAIWVPD